MSDTAEGLPPAVIDHAAEPTQIYCRECAFEESASIPDESREDLSVSQIGDVLVCDGCGVDIATTIIDDRDD
ncbi:hypothetical protein [Halobacterium salinarum]|uniref:hypothetical protein n=1 Tax=Halobacterium salinarum TaxID=2242 RepID=UPI0025571BE8|nr:hypothetical protein [Halobacterium salinarum]MDL0127098.1 hypothetical protein [Halobacterium salinarum]